MALRIRCWDPSTIKPGRIVLLVGRRGSGKSTIMRSILYHMRKNLDFGIAMSPTQESLQTFRDMMPDAWIYNDFSQSKLEELLAMQRQRAQKADKKKRQLFVVMDDCLYDKKVLKSLCVRDLFMNGRHYSTMLLCCAQYVMDMSPDLRSNVDYIVCTREMILNNKMKLWRYFFGCFEKFEQFSMCLDKTTENYSALVLDNTGNSNKLEDCVFWYRAPLDLPSFKIGAPAFWRLSEAHVKTRKQRDAEEYERSELDRVASERRRRRTADFVVHVEDKYGNLVDTHGKPVSGNPLIDL